MKPILLRFCFPVFASSRYVNKNFLFYQQDIVIIERLLQLAKNKPPQIMNIFTFLSVFISQIRVICVLFF